MGSSLPPGFIQTSGQLGSPNGDGSSPAPVTVGLNGVTVGANHLTVGPSGVTVSPNGGQRKDNARAVAGDSGRFSASIADSVEASISKTEDELPPGGSGTFVGSSTERFLSKLCRGPARLRNYSGQPAAKN